MNKFHVLLMIIIIFIFGAIIYSTQKDSFGKSDLSDQTSSFPPAESIFQAVSPSANNQQQETNKQVPQSAIQGPANASVSATIKTTKGDISVTLFGKEA